MKNGIGRLNFEHPPEPGTVLGPNYNKELIAVLETDEHGCTMRYAQTKDFQYIREPRSVTEHAMIAITHSVFGPIRSTSPYDIRTVRPSPDPDSKY